MIEENYGSAWTIDHCYSLSKTSLSNKIDRFISIYWINLGPMYIKQNITKGSEIDHRFYLMQEIKAKDFIRLNEEGLDQDFLNYLYSKSPKKIYETNRFFCNHFDEIWSIDLADMVE